MAAPAVPDHERVDPRAILDLLPHGVIVVSRDWRIAFANPEAERLIGASGATLWERCPALEHTALASGLRHAMAARTELLTESLLPRSGWCQTRARPTPDGGLLLSLRQVHPHTAETGQARTALLLGELGDAPTREDSLRAAEAALRKHARDLEVLHELGQQLSAMLDHEALARKVVDATTRLTGAEAGAFLYLASEVQIGSRTERKLDHAVTGTAPARRLLELAAPTLRDPRTVRIADLPAERGEPPGELAVASYLAVPVVGRSGHTIGALAFGHARPGMFTDETERLIAGVAATAAIAMDNARLFQEARALIAALESSNRELDQFAYVASHDLKAPLRGIANLAQWIEDDLGDRLDARTRDHLHLLRGRVGRLENLIDGILAYSRAGRDRSDEARVDLAALVAEVWELLAPPASARLEIATPLPQLFTSRVQLQQILLNLIGNAVKYNTGRELEITISARHSGRHWEFSVADNGVGIAPEYADKIWGLFQTLERRDQVESTGIGLAVVRKIVESHGGEAWVESAPGRGAMFRFTWAADTGEATQG